MANEKAARELKLWCFHQERLIGCFQPTLHTDIRTVVEALCRESTGRGRPITLSAERTAAVEAALHADGTHSSMAALRSAVVSWRSGTREAADAAGVNRYYDEWRVQGYTQKLEAPQQALCLRCLELSGLHPEALSGPPLVLDLGCGSGLSTTPLARRGCMSLGMDLSLEMLREARRRGCEVVQADMSLPLPLRPGVVDAVLSVSSLQFLFEPTEGRPAAQRLQTCVSEVARVVRAPPPFAAAAQEAAAATGAGAATGVVAGAAAA